ncbi:uncharacterized protein [Parasteatoda tepidariorum]|uniref:uncharacterized protein isoform X2 n=1 Tax=Parasteatoda tepidariorum TaxID=114398 RepID=UPI0039BC3C73
MMDNNFATKILTKLNVLSHDSLFGNKKIIFNSSGIKDLPDGSCFSRILKFDSDININCESTIRYVGSFHVSGSDQNERTEFVRVQLKHLRDAGPKRSVLLVISPTGIKVCTLDGKSVLMAHALRRISFATCDPEHHQFSFLAREPNGPYNLQFCHSFLAKDLKVAEELSEVVGSAFRMAYAQQLQQTPLSSGSQLDRQPARLHSSPVHLGLAAFPTTCREDARPATRVCWSKKLMEKFKQNDSITSSTMELCNQSISSTSSESSNNSLQQPATNSSRLKQNNFPLDSWSSLGACSSSEENISPADVNSCKQIKDKPLMQKNLDVVQENVLGDDHRDNTRSPNECTSKVSSCDNATNVNVRVSSETKSYGFKPFKKYTLENSTQTPTAPPRSDTLNSLVDRFSKRSNQSLPDCSVPSSSSETGECSGASGGSQNTKDNEEVAASSSNTSPPTPPERYDSLYVAISEEKKLRGAPWFQAGIPREIALEILNQEPVGSFMVRESTSKPGCFALSLRVPREYHRSGIAHYLILRTHRGYKIKGFTKDFTTLSALITHHSVMPELLPCPLSLSRYNPSFRNHDSEDMVDSDYNLLSDFRKILSDLNV